MKEGDALPSVLPSRERDDVAPLLLKDGRDLAQVRAQGLRSADRIDAAVGDEATVVGAVFRQCVVTVPGAARRASALPGILGPFGGARLGIAGVCPAGVRGSPQMRPAGKWLPAGMLRAQPRRASGCVQLKTPWFWPAEMGTD